MSWRTVVITKRAKLEYKLNYLVVRSDEVVKIHLSEIALIVIESTAVSLTTALICELANRKIGLLFCDDKRNPSSQCIPFYGSHDSSKKVGEQIKWDNDIKKQIWTEIVRMKLIGQKQVLEYYEAKNEAKLIGNYLDTLVLNDATNREAHAAKVYFNALFGLNFSRLEDCIFNAGLNYGYTVILACFNREIVSNGYLTQLGIFHRNVFNNFNLGSDLMEPFRVLVDKAVYDNNFVEFGSEEKMILLDLLNQNIKVDGRRQTILNGIKIYAKSVLDALSERDVSKIKAIEYEL